MRMLTTKKGSITESTIERWIVVVLLVVVLFKVLASLLPEAMTAGDELNASGMPLGSFFTSDGIVWIILALGLVILIFRSFMKHKK